MTGEDAMVLYIVMSFGCVIVIHLLVYAGMVSFADCGKKKYKHLISSISLWDRWFFISLQRLAKDRYCKSERRFIHYSIVSKIFQITNFVIHIAFIVEVMFFLLSFFVKLPFDPGHIFCAYDLVFFGCFLVLYFGDCYALKEFDRQRRRRR